MIQLAVLLPALAFSPATPPVQAAAPAVTAAVAAEDGASVRTVQDAPQASGTAEEPGFMEKYYPLTFADNLEPETDDKFVMLYLSGLFTWPILANIWLPIVTIGNPDGFLMDQVIGTIVHYVPMVCFPLIPLILAANALYLMPVQTVNAFDRNLKAAKRAGTWKAAGHEPVLPSEEELASLGSPAMAF